MKKLLAVSKGEHFVAQVFRTIAVLLIGVSLGLAFWTATTPMAQAQEVPTDQVSMNFSRAIEAEMPQGRTMANANKSQLLAAVCAAVKKSQQNAAQIARVAATARPELAKDILRTAFRCVADGNCALYGRIYRGVVAGAPGEASELNATAVQLQPDCASAFGGEPTDDDADGYGPTGQNANPPPGSIGGGGAQGGRCQVCHNGMTLTISCNAVPAHLGHGDTEGPCQVTPTQNP